MVKENPRGGAGGSIMGKFRAAGTGFSRHGAVLGEAYKSQGGGEWEGGAMRKGGGEEEKKRGGRSGRLEWKVFTSR